MPAIDSVYRMPAVLIQLDEAAATSSQNPLHPARIQILRCGTFYHERAGKVQITPKLLHEIAKNFKNKVRGIDLAIDFAHESEKIAAGWFRDVFLSPNEQELWAEVEWTPPGRSALNEKTYRYVSAEFSFDYQDNETLQKYGPVLLGAGLTNRPVIKKMTPAVELSEYKGDEMPGENPSAAADLLAQVNELKAEIAQLKAQVEALKQEKEGAMGESKKLSEKVATLEGEKTALAEKVALAEKTSAFEKLMSDGRAVPAQKEAYLAGDMVKFAELAAPLNTKPAGTSENPKVDSPTDGDAESKVLALAEKKLADKEVSDIGAAISLVLSEHKELAKQYRAKFAE